MDTSASNSEEKWFQSRDAFFTAGLTAAQLECFREPIRPDIAQACRRAKERHVNAAQDLIRATMLLLETAGKNNSKVLDVRHSGYEGQSPAVVVMALFKNEEYIRLVKDASEMVLAYIADERHYASLDERVCSPLPGVLLAVLPLPRGVRTCVTHTVTDEEEPVSLSAPYGCTESKHRGEASAGPSTTTVRIALSSSNRTAESAALAVDGFVYGIQSPECQVAVRRIYMSPACHDYLRPPITRSSDFPSALAVFKVGEGTARDQCMQLLDNHQILASFVHYIHAQCKIELANRFRTILRSYLPDSGRV
ncbi:hypothetical protein BV20DRAFT_979592 [Pilatotrama ljubarskyi]|nr:hypothetical protein BV20DRAFT_979592 [Pilatotrama ljubarskyi]